MIATLQKLMTDKEFCTLYGVFMIAWSLNDISTISYKLLNIEKRQKDDIQNNISSYLKGREYVKVQEYEKAFCIFDSLVKKSKTGRTKVKGLGYLCGRILGANGLGYMFAYGLYVQQDYKKAVSWFKKSADNGFSMSIFNLGICHEKGIGVNKNQEEANRLFHKAAELGFPPAKELEFIII